ncbi:hypothetical protein RhiirC2_800658 [Rhizophagus irregularis]|uniref:Uncharacterized protein n=1 Tax=Rhizophagus irregularis TaxID=588596 RepID=A0A2N1M3C5_9GLOM|nr:hypothetical protein RhiirC2_800658 [Rhizophagus irregularis]
MEDECNNNLRKKDNDNDDNGEETDDKYDNDDDNGEETDDDYHEENNDNYDEKTDDDYREENDVNYDEENIYYDDTNNVNDEDEMEEDYELEEDNIVDENDHEDTIIDSSIGNNQMSKINGSFAPYFENATSALLFCWIQKHNISTNSYNDLKIPSTSKATKSCYYLSIHDIIHNILNNLSLYNMLYFGPGIETEEKKEFWHGDLWAESPLFGQEKIAVNRVVFRSNEFVMYKENGSRRFG